MSDHRARQNMRMRDRRIYMLRKGLEGATAAKETEIKAEIFELIGQNIVSRKRLQKIA